MLIAPRGDHWSLFAPCDITYAIAKLTVFKSVSIYFIQAKGVMGCGSSRTVVVHSRASSRVGDAEQEREENLEEHQCSGCGVQYKGHPSETFCNECRKKLAKAARASGNASGEPNRQ